MEYFVWYLKVLKQYADFNGRARRKEFWTFALINAIVLIVLNYISMVLYYVYYLGILIPSIAVAIRRMHDLGKSGWYCLIPIYNIVLAATEGEPKDNEYGENPKDNMLLD